ncbi:DUF1080 domain-containing protein [bacterium]|nr:MAG: DUF1080 domain-containing protein [bacterium]
MVAVALAAFLLAPLQATEPGATLRLYEIEGPMQTLPELVPGQTPNLDRLVEKIDFKEGEFFGYKDHFIVAISADLVVATGGSHRFRVTSDDGAVLRIDGRIVLENDGVHAASSVDTTLNLTAGTHKLALDYFEHDGGEELKLEWQRPGESTWKVLDREVLRVPSGLTRVTSPGPKRIKIAGGKLRPGNGMPLDRLHPGWDLIQIRPEDFKPQVGCLAFRKDGKLLVGTFPPNQSGKFDPDLADGELWLLDGVLGNDRSKVTRKLIAQGLQEPLGMTVVGDDIYVSTRTAILKLVDTNGDDVIDRKDVVGAGWIADNYHHFAFGLAEKDGWLYAALSTSITFDAPGINGPNPRYRGSLFRVDPKRFDPKLPLANIEFLSSGHRTPNGVSNGPNGLILVGENQGSWQPSNKVNVLELGGFYGHVNANFRGAGVPGQFDDKPYTPAAIDLPQGEIANSPAQMLTIPSGEFAGHLLITDVKYGGLRRGWLENVDGVWQGGAVQYSQGFEVGTNRMVWGPDGALYIGGTGATESWAWTDPKTGQWTKFGLQKIKRNAKQTFEIETIHATPTGFKIRFNQPVDGRQLSGKDRYVVRQWRYAPTVLYGGPKVDRENLSVASIKPSKDRREVELVVPGAKAGRVVYFNLDLQSGKKQPLWASEAWYTLNRKPMPQVAPLSALAVEKPRVLVFSRTTGFRHDSIPEGIRTIKEIGAERGWTVEATEDPAFFTDEKLKGFDAVVFLATTGDVLNPTQQTAFEGFIHRGGGYVGVHSASDTEYDWPWYGKLVGAYFASHPQIQTADVRVVDVAHPSTAKLPVIWPRVDEWYNYRAAPKGVQVLAALDEKSYQGGTMGEHPIAWCHEFEGGRAWYTGLGHTKSSYDEMLFRDHLAEGILWAANARPTGTRLEGLAPWNHGGSWTDNGGVLKNDKGGAPLVTRDEFSDQQVHVEYRVPKNGNSGVYLMGRYEIQIFDSYGKPHRSLEHSDAGGLYQRWKDETGFEGTPPMRNAARPAGEWNSLDIVFRAPRFKNGKKVEDAVVVEARLNGVVVQTKATTTGPTRAAMFEDERATGPLMIQGDHGPTEIRNVWIKPLKL